MLPASYLHFRMQSQDPVLILENTRWIQTTQISLYSLLLPPLVQSKALLFVHGLVCLLKSQLFCLANTLLFALSPRALDSGFWLIPPLTSRKLSFQKLLPLFTDIGGVSNLLIWATCLLLGASFERFLGTPFFHSMVERSEAFGTDIVVFVDSQTVLLPDLVPALNFAHKLDGYWLLVASLQETSFFPFKLGGDGQHWLTENGKRLELDEV
ncbi:unnamed protein product [Linum tenue]|uniref:Uncharacterized protein n=1 Tax=Linum tenue TaxID=586396 RepID=A0AAV0HZS2_9ROSI|nr:unnamed protein product [Linum tenue]